MLTWSDLYLQRELDRQRREAMVALQSAKRVRAQYPVEHPTRTSVVRAALRTLLECPLAWGDDERVEVF